MNYKGDLLGGPLLTSESKVIAELLLKELSDKDFRYTIEVENVLQKRSIASTKRNTTAIKKRLLALGTDFIELLVYADSELASQVCMAGVIKQNRLLGDYMLYIVSDHFKLGRDILEKHTWYSFVDEVKQINSEDISFSESSTKKMAQVVCLILSDSGFLEDTKSKKIQKMYLRPELRILLEKNNEKYILACLEIGK